MDIQKGLFTYLTAPDVSQTLSTCDRATSSHYRYMHSNPISDVRISVLLAPPHLCYPPFPWILKLGGLEGSGLRLISWNYKTNKVALYFLFWQTLLFLLKKLKFFGIFWYFENFNFPDVWSFKKNIEHFLCDLFSFFQILFFSIVLILKVLYIKFSFLENHFQ